MWPVRRYCKQEKSGAGGITGLPCTWEEINTETWHFKLGESQIFFMKARRKWQHSHNPEDKTTYNRLTNRLKEKLKEAQNASFYDYVSNLR
jgi:hypothetical protein